MGIAIGFGIASFVVGGALAFFNQGIGVVAAISIIGIGVIYSNVRK